MKKLFFACLAIVCCIIGPVYLVGESNIMEKISICAFIGIPMLCGIVFLYYWSDDVDEEDDDNDIDRINGYI